MKITHKQLRRLITEAMLGKWVWPSALKGHSMINEPDTAIEEILYQQLHNHFGAIAPINDDAILALQQILASGQYSEIFVPCKSGPILRGMRLPVSWLEQHAPEAITTLTDKEKDPVDWAPPVVIKPLMYKSEGKYGNVSSWTNDWMTARRFTTQWSPDTVPVILHSDCSTGYFMYTQSFARYKGGSYRDKFDIRKLNPQGKSEKEILLFGECYVTAVQVNITKQDYARLKI
jgi:hypothetical protein